MPAEGRPDAALMLRIARRDLKAAKGMLDEEVFDEATWGFQIQQATEKALKAWISCQGQNYPRTHDLLLLCGLISDLGGDPSPFQQLVNFNPFGTPDSATTKRNHWALIARSGTNVVPICSITWPR